MNSAVEMLNIVAPVLAIAFVLFISLVNLYRKIRRKFPIVINCWFCQANCKVPYDNLNSFICYACEQYNGFKEDGDYNRDVKEMYYSKLNPKVFTVKNHYNTNRYSAKLNGLCKSCNRNQDLKVHQLASFVPENENNFDEEVSEYEKQLEQTYKLCHRCDRVLKKTLNNVKCNILGSKLAQIGFKGLKIFDQHMEKAKYQKANNQKKSLVKICIHIIIIISIMNLYETINKFSTTKNSLDEFFHDKVSNIILFLIINISWLKNMLIHQLTALLDYMMLTQTITYIQTTLNIAYQMLYTDSNYILKYIGNNFSDTKFLANISVIILNLILLKLYKGLSKTKPLLLILIWSLEMIFSSTFLIRHFVYNSTLYGLLKIVTSTFSVILSFKCFNTVKFNMMTENNSSFHKIYSEQNSDLSSEDEDENEDEIELMCKSMSSSASSMKNSHFNNTLNSTQSVHDSLFTASTLRKYNLEDSFDYNKSVSDKMSSRYSVENLKQPLLHNNNQHYNSFKTLLNNTHNSSSILGINKCCSADDNVFYNDIDKLSINNVQLGNNQSVLNQSKNPFSYDYDENNRSLNCTPSVTSEISYYTRQRKNIISPPRLNGSINGADANSSWVAGGFWGQTTSPLKKQDNNFNRTFSSANNQHDFLPILSRTSSQSSGFESHASTANGFANDDRNVNDIDRLSLFCEPTYRRQDYIRSNSKNRSIYRNLYNQTTIKPEAIYPYFGNTENLFIHPSSLKSGNVLHSSSNSLYDKQSKSPNYHQFGTHKVRRSLLNLDILKKGTTGTGDYNVSASSLANNNFNNFQDS